MVSVPPTRTISRSWSTRSSLTWMAGETSAISSRNSVPPSASSNRPALRSVAPVNAPASWPNSSDSSSVSGRAAQLMAMKDFSARSEWVWIIRAASSLPVPVSPSSRTVALDRATRRMSWRTSSMASADADDLLGRLVGLLELGVLPADALVELGVGQRDGGEVGEDHAQGAVGLVEAVALDGVEHLDDAERLVLVDQRRGDQAVGVEGDDLVDLRVVVAVLGDVVDDLGLARLQHPAADAVVAVELHADELLGAVADGRPEHLLAARLVQDDHAGRLGPHDRSGRPRDGCERIVQAQCGVDGRRRVDQRRERLRRKMSGDDHHGPAIP